MHHAIPLLASALMMLPLGAQSPGVHRVQLGTLQVTALQDSEGVLSQDLLKGMEPAEAARLLGGAGPVATSTNAFLVEMGGHRILVDAGRSDGHLAERLAQAGVEPESIEVILLTHLHPDHFGGLLTREGKPVFPNAQIRLPQAEHAYWTDPKVEAAAPDGRKPLFKALRGLIAAYGKAYQPFAPGGNPWPGVEALSAPGHTPGHTAYLFGHGREALWVVGDVVHFQKVQFPHPEVTVAFDSDGPRAARSRVDLLQRAARENPLLAGAHLAFPGLGRIEVRPQGFAWIPVK